MTRIRVATTHPRRVLIVRLSAIGDTILTSPLVDAIKRHYPQTEVDWIVGAKSLPIVRMMPLVSEVFVFPKLMTPLRMLSSPLKGLDYIRNLTELKHRMSERRYDVALDVQGLLKSGVASSLSCAQFKVGWQPEDVREMNWLFTNTWVPMPKGVHVVDSWLSMLKVLGIEPDRGRFPIVPPVEAMEEMRQYVDRVSGGRPLVVMNVGASKLNKCWPVEKYSELARRAADAYGTLAVFTYGSQWERELAVQAVQQAGEAAVIGPETSLYTLAALLAYSTLYIGGDTGPTHLAAALGVPCLGVFGVTDPTRTRPYGENNVVISRFRPGDSWRSGNLADQQSMDEIEVEEVYSHLSRMLEAVPQQVAVATDKTGFC